MNRHLPAGAALFVAMVTAAAADLRAGPPVALDDRLTVELVAQEPQLVTPTGVACDVRDNAWVIESNTHFPPKDYKRHPTDRIWVFSAPPVDGTGAAASARDAAAARGGGSVGDAASGKAGTPQAGAATQPATRPGATLDPVAETRQVLFADGFKLAMSLSVTPAGRVYVTCRDEIVLLDDKDHDLKPDPMPAGPGTQPAADGKPADRRTLVRLDTAGTYPHNGLNGVVLSPDGAYLYFCLGLNAGYDYTVTGSDGSKVSGGGEGGSIWRCTPDGGKVERVATGFWNCHDLTFDAFGRLFAVDNDPDDIGPCRLLDIIDGGDYGWKFKNGRKGVHPFTSWDGHLPGTLPMVAGTGEAPSGVLAYESDDWPADYRGQLLVTSWGDHVIQRFELKEKGASFTSTPVDVVRGGEDFRPVGIAQAADGSVWVTDWVDKSYTLHGKGKLWRVRAKRGAKGGAKAPAATGEPKGSVPRPRADDVAKLTTASDRLKLLGDPRREVRAAAADALVPNDDQGVDDVLADILSGRKVNAVAADALVFNDGRAVDKVLAGVLSGKDVRAALDLLWAYARKGPAGRAGEFPASAARYSSQATVRAEALRLDSPGPRDGRDFERWLGDGITFGPTVDGPLYRRTLQVVPAEYPLHFQLPVMLKSVAGDPFLASAFASAVARGDELSPTLARIRLEGPSDAARAVDVLTLIAARRSDLSERFDVLPALLRAGSPPVRRYALQWVGEDRLTQFAPNVGDALKGEGVSRDLLAAYLACREKLATPPAEPGKPVAERSGRQFAADFLFDEANDLRLRKIALELVDPADPKLPSGKFVALLGPMGLEAVKALAWRDDAESQAALRAIAADAGKVAGWRREAVAGLARSALTSADSKRVLVDLLFDGPAVLRTDALQSLRGALTPAEAGRAEADVEAAEAKPGWGPDDDLQEWAEQVLLAVKPTPDALPPASRQHLARLVKSRPTDTAGWQAVAAGGGDPDAGRRVFSLATAAKCYVCHAANDRGGQVGPDLSGVGRAMDRAKIVESILEPSKEVAPLYVSQVIELRNGDTISGVGLPEPGAAFVSIADATGKRVRVRAEDIVSRRTEKVSVMPDNLVDGLSVREFRDLVAYLASRKGD